MSQLEDRLRRELPALADEMTGEHQDPDQASVLSAKSGATKPGWPPVAAAAAAVAVIAGAVGLIGIRSENTRVSTTSFAAAPAPSSFGSWAPMADSPLSPRPYAVSAWTGSEAIFWAGTNLDRSFAYVDGALYDPANNTWRDLEVPGWGHPGLTSVYFDGKLYVLAKGSGSTFDPLAASWADLPQVKQMLLAAMVSTDTAVWGLGPPLLNQEGPADLAIARYEPASDSWENGPVYEAAAEQGGIAQALTRLEAPVMWTGSEIVVWGGEAGTLAFDPGAETWREIAAPIPPDGLPAASTAVVTNRGLAAVVAVDRQGQDPIVSVAVLNGQGWNWLDAEIPIADPNSLTAAAAGDWIVLFSADEAPVVVHVPSGSWQRDSSAPLQGLRAPNTVWTGNSLIVWGGVTVPTKESSLPPNGAVWTPPGN